MIASIKDFRDFTPAKLYELVTNVYATSEGMSEAIEDKYPTAESFEQELEDLSHRPGSIFLVADVGGEPSGYILIKPRLQSKLRHTAELNMGVDHRARGRGIGSLLLEEALHRASVSNEVEIVYLTVRADNRSAVHLYEKAGFEKLAVLDRDTKIGDCYYDGILMRKFVTDT